MTPPGSEGVRVLVSVQNHRCPTILSTTTTTSAKAITGCIVLLTLSVSTVTAHDLRLWNLPSVAKQRNRDHPFIHRCDSLTAALERLRAGDSSYSSKNIIDNNNDDWSTYGNIAEKDSYSSRRRHPGEDRYSSSGRYYDEDYDDYDRAPQRSRSTTGKVGFGALPKILKNGDRRIGLPLLASGVVITLLGISLFFNKALLRLGNLLFIAGVPMTIGPSRTFGYFVQAEKMRATVCLALGIFLVFVGHPIFGMILEAFGVLNLFGNMFPVVMTFAKHMPVVGSLLKSTNGKAKSRRRDDDYYDDYGRRMYDDQPPQENIYDVDYREDEGSRSNVPYY